MGSYVPSTLQERQEMLESIGLSSIDQLFSHIPDELKLKGELNLPSGMSELEVSSAMKKIAAKNVVFGSIFRGAGAYDHYIPSIVKSVTGKEEFLTAYTPYQAEISQGVLQSIFEYQTMICELTGMDVSNASVYDGATAAAEAVNMCCERSRKVVFCSAAAHPDTIAVVKTYCWAAGHELVLLPVKDGKTDLDAMASQLDKKTSACLYLQSPNFFGQLEEMEKAAEMIHSVGAKLIAGCNPIALGLLKTPAEQGADIAVGEGQPLGMPLSFGGPYLGFMAATQAMMRKLPGRIGRCRWQTCLRPHPSGKRAAHPPRKSLQQHLLQPGAVCTDRFGLPGYRWTGRTQTGSFPVLPESTLSGTAALLDSGCQPALQRHILP